MADEKKPGAEQNESDSTEKTDGKTAGPDASPPSGSAEPPPIEPGKGPWTDKPSDPPATTSPSKPTEVPAGDADQKPAGRSVGKPTDKAGAATPDKKTADTRQRDAKAGSQAKDAKESPGTTAAAETVKPSTSTKPGSATEPKPIPQSTPSPAAAPRRSGGAASIVAAVVISVLLIGIAFATWPQWSPAVTSYLPGWQAADETEQGDPRFAALEERLAALDGAVAEAREAPATEPDVSGAVEQLTVERDALAARVDALEERVAVTDTVLQEVRQAAEAATEAAETARTATGALAAAGGEAGDAAAMTQAVVGVLDELTARIDVLEAGQDETGALDQRLGALEDLDQRLTAVDDLDQRLGALEDAAVEAAEAAAVAAAEPPPPPSPPPSALVLAVGQLRGAARGSGSFTAELEALAAVAAGDTEISQAVETLSPYAESGVPTLDTLTRQFGGVAADVVRARHTIDSGDWWAKAANRVVRLVSWRRTGEAAEAAGGVDAIVAQAEAALAAGDLAAAVSAMETLEGDPATAAEAWLATANARQTIDGALSRLQARAVSLLAQAEG